MIRNTDFTVRSFFMLIFILFLLQWPAADAQDLSLQSNIIRTEYGVPHIQAENIAAAGYAMGYIQMEDYGEKVISGLIRARGEWAKYHELSGNQLEKQLDEDAASRIYYQKAVETFPRLNIQTRQLTEGYTKGVNRYIELHPGEFPGWVKPDFTNVDVHAVGIGRHGNISLKRFIKYRRETDASAAISGMTPWANIALNTKKENPDIGSNAWALAPERTKSGKAILLRNPHLNWDAGYYEAQMTVEGMFDFYGDFRIGQPLGVVGGFNRYLGWATTNNHPEQDVIYALTADPENPDYYLLDGDTYTLEKRVIKVDYLQGNQKKTTERTFFFTAYGPVIYRTDRTFFIVKSTKEGEYRNDQQYLQMMQAKNLDQWKDAMRMQGLYESNLTYADGDGNIFYVWNAATPVLPYERRDDLGIIAVDKSSEIWSDLYPWDKLPQLLNPKGGYVHNENDPFYYTNLHEVFKESDFPDNFPRPRLGLRSQLSLELIGGDDKLSLEDVIYRKGNTKMLLADRVKEDLIKALNLSRPDKKVKDAIKLMQSWDNTVSRTSRGSMLFELWWNQYVKLSGEGKNTSSSAESAGFSAPAGELFSTPWTPEDPAHTPYGLANPKRAVDAFKHAMQECKTRYASIDVEWGKIHRAKIGDQNYAVGGATGGLGCFRVLWYEPDPENDVDLNVTGGDGWVIAIEFDKIPRAYSVLAYGESNKAGSPYYGDQLKMFVNKEMKTVLYKQEDIKKHIARSYHPGQSE